MTSTLHLVDLQGGGEPGIYAGQPDRLLLWSTRRPVQSQLAIMGDMSLGGVITPARNLAESLQVAFDAGCKADTFANVECGGYSDRPWGAVCEVPDQLLFGSGGCGVQGGGG
jgi:predicted ATP-dependent Lon-type protease